MMTLKQERYINYLFRTKKWEESRAVCSYNYSHYMSKYDASCLIQDLLNCEDKEVENEK